VNDVSEVAGPVQSTERMLLIDVLRGLALFGILQINWGGRGPAMKRRHAALKENGHDSQS